MAKSDPTSWQRQPSLCWKIPILSRKPKVIHLYKSSRAESATTKLLQSSFDPSSGSFPVYFYFVAKYADDVHDQKVVLFEIHTDIHKKKVINPNK